MGLTRFYDPVTDRDGPTSGALTIISVGFDDIANNEVASRRINLPAGCSFYITDVLSSADVSGDNPQLTVGSTVGGVEIVASIAMTTTKIAHTLVANQVAADGLIDVVLTADAGDAVESGSVTVVGYMSAPPTSVPDRGADAPG